MPTSMEMKAIFDTALADFKTKLTPTQRDAFIGTTATTLEVTAKQIEIDHHASGTSQNMGRLMPFIDSLTSYSEVIGVFVQVSDLMAFIWGPVCLLLKVAAKWHSALDRLLDALESIGDKLDIFDRHSELFSANADHRLQGMLGRVYSDVLNILLLALKIFPRSIIKQVGIAIWPPFENRLNVILNKFDSDRRLLESALTAENFKESRRFLRDLEENFRKEEKARKALALEALRQCLRPVTSQSNLEHARDIVKNQRDTGQWLISSMDAWMRNTAEQRVIALTGIPGAGKTILASVLVNKLNELKSTFVDYQIYSVFLTYHQGQNHSGLEALCSLLYQAVVADWELYQMLLEKYGPDLRDMALSKEQLQEALTGIASMAPTFIVIDGLDEISEKERQLLLGVLRAILESSQTTRVFFSARPEPDILRTVGAWQIKQKLISITPTLNYEDLKTFVLEPKNTGMLVQTHGYGKDEATRLLCAIVDKSQGMFLYAKLVIEDLHNQTCPREVEAAIENLPRGLEEAYERVFQRLNLPTARRKRVKRILKLLLGARRPLRVSEMRQAIMMDDGLDELDARDALSISIEEICGSLVQIRNNKVSFVHFSVHEYLAKHDRVFAMREHGIHKTISILCLRYLSLKTVCRDIPKSEFERHLNRGEYAFFAYAGFNWMEHLKASTVKGSTGLDIKILGLLKRFCSQHFKETSVTKEISLKDIRPYLMAAQAHHRLRSDNLDSEDPSDLTAFARRINEFLLAAAETIPETDFSILLYCYGRPFRCSNPSCDFFQGGFDNRKELDAHEINHKRPFKCELAWCPNSVIGFVSEAALVEHKREHVEESAPAGIESGRSVDCSTASLRPEDYKSMLMDALSTNDIAAANMLLDQIYSQSFENRLSVLDLGPEKQFDARELTTPASLRPRTIWEAASISKESSILSRLLSQAHFETDDTKWLRYLLYFTAGSGLETNTRLIMERIDYLERGFDYYWVDNNSSVGALWPNTVSAFLFAILSGNDKVIDLFTARGVKPSLIDPDNSHLLIKQTICRCNPSALQKVLNIFEIEAKPPFWNDVSLHFRIINTVGASYKDKEAMLSFLEQHGFKKFSLEQIVKTCNDLDDLTFWIKRGTKAHNVIHLMHLLLVRQKGDRDKTAKWIARLLETGLAVDAESKWKGKRLTDYPSAKYFPKRIGKTFEQAIEDSKEERERVKREDPYKWVYRPSETNGEKEATEEPEFDFADIQDEYRFGRPPPLETSSIPHRDHPLKNFQMLHMQLMLLDQQNKKRLMMEAQAQTQTQPKSMTTASQIQASQLLLQAGINPNMLTQQQFLQFQASNPEVQQNLINVYLKSLAFHQRSQLQKEEIPNAQVSGVAAVGGESMMRQTPADAGPGGTMGDFVEFLSSFDDASDVIDPAKFYEVWDQIPRSEPNEVGDRSNIPVSPSNPLGFFL